MVLADYSSSVPEQAPPEHSSPAEISDFVGLAVSRTAGDQRNRVRIGDLDRASCRTRLSQRRFLIQLQAEPAVDIRGEVERCRASMINGNWSGRVVDWD